MVYNQPMSFALFLLLVVLGAYLVGSVPTAIIFGYLIKGVDIRSLGSGNAGATNAVRVLGFGWGLVVGIIDLAKGAVPVLVAQSLAGTLGHAEGALVLLAGIVAGVGALLGHALPIFAGFRGGKGVATGAGMVLALWPLVFLYCLAGFLLGLFLTGFVSVGSMAAAIILPTLQGIFFSPLNPAARIQDRISFILGIVVMVFVVILHRKNISRLLQGTEKRFDKVWLLRPLFTGKADRNGQTNEPPSFVVNAPSHDIPSSAGNRIDFEHLRQTRERRRTKSP